MAQKRSVVPLSRAQPVSAVAAEAASKERRRMYRRLQKYRH
jgi:hypothetical protein